MKKILIGCGVLVLLVIVGFGVLAWSVKDEIASMTKEMTASAAQLHELDDEHPFTPPATAADFDERRFLLSLDARSAMMTELGALDEQFKALENGDLGFFETITQSMKVGMQAGGAVYDAIAAGLAQVDMGPDEFVYHTKVLWASLKAVDAELGGESLAPYRSVFTTVDAETGQQLRFQPNTPDSLSAFVEGVPSGVVDEAVAVLGDNVEELQQALPADQATDLARAIDIITMTLPSWMDDMKGAVAEMEQQGHVETK